jgi:hypothetical protein
LVTSYSRLVSASFSDVEAWETLVRAFETASAASACAFRNFSISRLVSCHDDNGVTQLSVQTHAWKVVCTSNSLIISATDFALLLLFDDEDVPPFAFAAAGDDFEALLLDGVFFIFEFLCVCARVRVCAHT